MPRCMSPKVALFGPDAPGRRCPLIGEEQKFAARCQSDAIDPACVKRRRLRLAVEVGNDEAILCPDCLHQTTNAQNADYPFHIVGQDV